MCHLPPPPTKPATRRGSVGLIIILCGLMMTLSAPLSAAPESVASLNGVQINYEQFNECYKLRRAQLKGETIAPRLKDYITFFAMKPFVDELLINEELKRRGLTIDEARVDQRVKKIRDTFKTEEAFTRYLNRKMQSTTSFRIQQRVKEGAYLILDADKLIEPTEAEIKEKRAKALERLNVPEQVRGRQLMLSLPDQATPAQVNEKFKKIQEIHGTILKEGKDFGIYIQRYSQGPLRGRNGDIGYVSKGDLEPPVEQALWALKDGELSAPFRSRYGWHIIQRRDTIKAHQRSINELLPNLKERLKLIKFNKEMHLFIKRLWQKGVVQTKVTLPPAYRGKAQKP